VDESSIPPEPDGRSGDAPGGPVEDEHVPEPAANAHEQRAKRSADAAAVRGTTDARRATSAIFYAGTPATTICCRWNGSSSFCSRDVPGVRLEPSVAVDTQWQPYLARLRVYNVLLDFVF